MPEPILLRGAKQLLTLRGPAGARRGAALRELAVIEDGSLLIRDGKIVHVGTTRRIENLKEARDAIEIAAHGRVAMPGFIDPGLDVGLADQGTGELGRRRKKPVELLAETRELLRACLQHGTLSAELRASAEAPNFHSDVAVLRQLSRIRTQALDIVSTWRAGQMLANGDRDTADFIETLKIITRRKLAQFLEVQAPPDSIWNEQMTAAIAHSALPLKLVWQGGSGQGRPDEALAEVVSRFRPRSVFCPQPLNANECETLAASPAIAIFSPGKDALHGLAANSAREVADAGGAIALSSGYDSRYSPSFSMQMVVALAVARLRLTAEEAISAATINAAHASGCGETAGSLEYGKRANLLLLDISDYRDLPRRFGVNHVALAMRDGAVVFSRNRGKVGAA